MKTLYPNKCLCNVFYIYIHLSSLLYFSQTYVYIYMYVLLQQTEICLFSDQSLTVAVAWTVEEVFFLPVLISTPHNRGGQAQFLPDWPGLSWPHIQYLVLCEKRTKTRRNENMSGCSWQPLAWWQPTEMLWFRAKTTSNQSPHIILQTSSQEQLHLVHFAKTVRIFGSFHSVIQQYAHYLLVQMCTKKHITLINNTG